MILNSQIIRRQIILKRHRRKSEQSEREYQNLFDSSPVPMWIFDRDTLHFLLVNKAAIAHYGYSKTEFLRMTLKDIRPSTKHARLEENIRQMQGSAENKDTWRHLRKDGQVIIVEVISTNVIFKNTVRRLAVVHDITAIRMAEEKIFQQNKQLREIAFQASHIVRAPLANILGLAAVIDAKEHSAEEKDELFGLIKISAGQLDEVIRDIVDQTIKVNH